MLYSIKNRYGLEVQKELPSLQNQVKELGLQHELGKQRIHEKVFEPVTDIVEEVSNDSTQTVTEKSKVGHKAISNLNRRIRIFE